MSQEERRDTVAELPSECRATIQVVCDGVCQIITGRLTWYRFHKDYLNSITYRYMGSGIIIWSSLGFLRVGVSAQVKVTDDLNQSFPMHSFIHT